MAYIYHRVPENLKSERLYPLNRMKEMYPEIYQQGIKKYDERKEVLEYKVPILNCLWNDVLHFSAVHPKDVRDALAQAGSKKPFPSKWFMIDSVKLEPSKLVLYTHEHAYGNPSEQDFLQIDSIDINKYQSVPQATREYYSTAIAIGMPPKLSLGLPHVLYKGDIAIGDFETLDL